MNHQIFEINSKKELEEVVKNNKGILLLDFTSPTCGPCLMLEPIFEEMVEKKICSIAKINIHENESLAIEYKIQVTPTVFIVKDQEVKEIAFGYKPIEDWEEIIRKI